VENPRVVGNFGREHSGMRSQIRNVGKGIPNIELKNPFEKCHETQTFQSKIQNS
jgi:hypothetical protein